MRKGFIHMIEIILVSVIVIMTIPTFLYPFSEKINWNDKVLTTTGMDFLATTDKISDGRESFLQNIMGKNESEIYYEFIRVTSSRKINYGIYTRGSLKNKIRIGFNCTTCDATAEKVFIRSILSPSFVNNRLIDFEIFPFSYDNFNRYGMDVIFLTKSSSSDDSIDQANDNIDKIKTFLEGNGGVVEVVDSNSIDLNANLQKEIFGITSGGLSGGNLTFVNPDGPKKQNYYIQKYFYGVGVYVKANSTGIGNFTLWKNKNYLVRMNNTGCGGYYCKVDVDKNGDGVFEPDELGYSEGDTFSIEHNSKYFGFIVDKIDEGGKYTAFNFMKHSSSEGYVFDDFTENDIEPVDGDSNRKILTTSSGRPGAILNNTSGRAVWIDYGYGDDVSALVKSSTIWAAGNDWWNVLKTLSGEHQKISYFVSQGEDFHEPYWVELNLWYIY